MKKIISFLLSCAVGASMLTVYADTNSETIRMHSGFMQLNQRYRANAFFGYNSTTDAADSGQLQVSKVGHRGVVQFDLNDIKVGIVKKATIKFSTRSRYYSGEHNYLLYNAELSDFKLDIYDTLEWENEPRETFPQYSPSTQGEPGNKYLVKEANRVLVSDDVTANERESIKDLGESGNCYKFFYEADVTENLKQNVSENGFIAYSIEAGTVSNNSLEGLFIMTDDVSLSFEYYTDEEFSELLSGLTVDTVGGVISSLVDENSAYHSLRNTDSIDVAVMTAIENGECTSQEAFVNTANTAIDAYLENPMPEDDGEYIEGLLEELNTLSNTEISAFMTRIIENDTRSVGSCIFEIEDSKILEADALEYPVYIYNELTGKAFSSWKEVYTAFNSAYEKYDAEAMTELKTTAAIGENSYIKPFDTGISINVGTVTLPAGYENATLKQDGVEVEGVSYAENVLTVPELLPATVYEIVWDGGYIFFTTKGIVNNFNVFGTKAIKVEEEATLTGKEYKNGAFEELTEVSTGIADDGISELNDGVLKGLKRGVTVVSVLYDNEGDLTTDAEQKITFAVANSILHKDFVEGFESGKQSVITSDFDADYVQMTLKADSDIKLYVGDTVFEIEASENFRQISVFVNGEKTALYINGVKASEIENSNHFTSVCVETTNGAQILDSDICDVMGSLCYANSVVVRKGLNGTIEGTYGYFDDDSDTEDGTTFRWLDSDNNPISGETGTTFTKASKYEGEKVKFAVTPKNMYDTGIEVVSDAFTIPKTKNKSSGRGSGGGEGGNSGFIAPSVTNTPVVDNTADDTQDNTDDNTVNDETQFSDISEHWAKNEIAELAQKGVINGFEDGSYKPDETVTRGQFLCALLKAFDVQLQEYEEIFTDVSENDWYAQYVITAYKNGIVNGMGEGKFTPNNNITREQMCVMLEKLYTPSESGESVEFSDADEISEWAVDAVGKMSSLGIIQGRENNMFAPSAFMTRAEMAVVLSRVLK